MYLSVKSLIFLVICYITLVPAVILDDEADTCAANTSPELCTTFRKNGYVMLKGHPCKIVEIKNSNAGNVDIVGLDVLTGKKYEDSCPSTHKMVRIAAYH